ncbi:hypothetical protein GRJ2_002707300 [Grus japonensis]|uniref:Uncharacterized protein n=1 Tax=Grus japonensis TaxID=30415 RepID=A0ABC9XZX6_GRUJA
MAAPGLVLLVLLVGGRGGGARDERAPRVSGNAPLPPSAAASTRPSPTPPGGTPNPGGGNESRGGPVELEVLPPGGTWPEAWGWGGPVGAMAVAYVALGGAVLVGLCQRHRALQSRKRRRRLGDPAQSPTVEEEEEGEGEEGYEHPDSETEVPGEGYENEAGPPRGRSSTGSYENEPEAADASPYANTRLAPGSCLRSQPYEEMAGGGMGPEDDAASYENMDGTAG